MSELEKTKSFYDDLGIVYNLNEYDGIIQLIIVNGSMYYGGFDNTVTVEQNNKRVGGYRDFHVTYVFSMSGELISMNIWE